MPRTLNSRPMVVEPDSGRMGVRKDKAAAQKIHLGRTLVLKGRFTKKWVARALPDLSFEDWPRHGS